MWILGHITSAAKSGIGRKLRASRNSWLMRVGLNKCNWLVRLEGLGRIEFQSAVSDWSVLILCTSTVSYAREREIPRPRPRPWASNKMPANEIRRADGWFDLATLLIVYVPTCVIKVKIWVLRIFCANSVQKMTGKSTFYHRKLVLVSEFHRGSDSRYFTIGDMNRVTTPLKTRFFH